MDEIEKSRKNDKDPSEFISLSNLKMPLNSGAFFGYKHYLDLKFDFFIIFTLYSCHQDASLSALGIAQISI